MLSFGLSARLLDAGILLVVPVWRHWSRAIFGDEPGFVHGEAVQAVEVVCNTAIKAIGHALALVGLAEQSLIARIADEGDFRKHRRHIRANQHDERRFLHAAVVLFLAHGLEAARKRILNIRC